MKADIGAIAKITLSFRNEITAASPSIADTNVISVKGSACDPKQPVKNRRVFEHMTTTIYVKLLNEGTDVWRPVDAVEVSHGLFRLARMTDESEVLEFPPGSIVRVENRGLSSGLEMVAVESSVGPKFTWGDSVVVTGSCEAGDVCAITESDNGFSYTVEFSDGTDRELAEDSLEADVIE